jgi:hypothetical protein
MQRNWYANYSRAVADGWEYKEVTVEEMYKLIDNLPVGKERERAGMRSSPFNISYFLEA